MATQLVYSHHLMYNLPLSGSYLSYIMISKFFYEYKKRRRRSPAVWRLSRGSDGFALDESLGFSHVRASTYYEMLRRQQGA